MRCDVSSFTLLSGWPFSDYEWALNLQEIMHKTSLGEAKRLYTVQLNY